MPLDIDTFVMDQSDTAKEGVSRTYASQKALDDFQFELCLILLHGTP